MANPTANRANQKFQTLLEQLKETGVTKSDMENYSKETLESIKSMHESVGRVENLIGKDHDPNQSISDIVSHMDELFRDLRNEIADSKSPVEGDSTTVSTKELKKQAEKLSDNGSDLSESQVTLMMLSREPLKELQLQTILLKKLVGNTTESDFTNNREKESAKDDKEGLSLLSGILKVGGTIAGGISSIAGFLFGNPILTMGIAALGAALGPHISSWLKEKAAEQDNLHASDVQVKYQEKEIEIKAHDMGDLKGASEKESGEIHKGKYNTGLWGMFDDRDADTKTFHAQMKSKTASQSSLGILPKIERGEGQDNDMDEVWTNGFPTLKFTQKFLDQLKGLSEAKQKDKVYATLFEYGFISDLNDPEAIQAGWDLYFDQFKSKSINQVKGISATRLDNLKAQGQVSSIDGFVVTTKSDLQGNTTIQSYSPLERVLSISTLSDVKDNDDLASNMRTLATVLDYGALVGSGYLAYKLGKFLRLGKALDTKANLALAKNAGRKVGMFLGKNSPKAVNAARGYASTAKAGLKSVSGSASIGASSAFFVLESILMEFCAVVKLYGANSTSLKAWKEKTEAELRGQNIWEEFCIAQLEKALMGEETPVGTFAMYTPTPDYVFFEPISAETSIVLRDGKEGDKEALTDVFGSQAAEGALSVGSFAGLSSIQDATSSAPGVGYYDSGLRQRDNAELFGSAGRSIYDYNTRGFNYNTSGGGEGDLEGYLEVGDFNNWKWPEFMLREEYKPLLNTIMMPFDKNGDWKRTNIPMEYYLKDPETKTIQSKYASKAFPYAYGVRIPKDSVEGLYSQFKKVARTNLESEIGRKLTTKEFEKLASFGAVEGKLDPSDTTYKDELGNFYSQGYKMEELPGGGHRLTPGAVYQLVEENGEVRWKELKGAKNLPMAEYQGITGNSDTIEGQSSDLPLLHNMYYRDQFIQSNLTQYTTNLRQYSDVTNLN
jgi:hypothetical protein